jgi:uncharacterized repeat protein (TIGR01451 family)
MAGYPAKCSKYRFWHRTLRQRCRSYAGRGTACGFSCKLLIVDTLEYVSSMRTEPRIAARLGALLAFLLSAMAVAQNPTNPLVIRAIAEVESKSNDGGREVPKLIPADRVVPGDRVLYTLEVRNTGATGVDSPSVTYAVPDHMKYVADSAVGPGAEVSYSVDGGHSFDSPGNLRVPGIDGRARLAAAADYTHLRWRLKNSLKANSVAFVRFRALVK